MNKSYCKTSEEILSLFKGMMELDIHPDVDDLKNQMGTRTFNSRGFLMWDLRYEHIATISEQNGLAVIWIKRGGLWTLVATLNEEVGELFIFMTNENPIKSIEKDSHYLSQLLEMFNSDLNNEPNSEVSLFDMGMPHLEENCKEMLNEYFDKISRIFIIRTETAEGITYLDTYNGYRNLLVEEVIPDGDITNPDLNIEKPEVAENISNEDENIGLKIKKQGSKRKIN